MSKIKESQQLSGKEFVLKAEDVLNKCMEKVHANVFWTSLVNIPEDVPESVYHGMCVENYHLLFRESYFDSPVLAYPAYRDIREKMNEFYCEEMGHDNILLEALNFIGISRDDLYNSVPLQTTSALYNTLSYWSRYDPIFFFLTLGPLEGNDVAEDSYIQAMRKKRMPEEFINPILSHAHINANSEHGQLTREIFACIPQISVQEADRMISQLPLFVDIYDRFYSGIWNYYSQHTIEQRALSQF